MFGRKRTATIEGPLTHETLRAWLVAELARMVKIPEAEVDTAKPFDAYGLDSRAAVQVSGALEKVVERRLSPGNPVRPRDDRRSRGLPVARTAASRC